MTIVRYLWLCCFPLFCLGQQSGGIKTQKTVFTISAVDDKTSAEVAAQFTIEANQSKKKFVGKSQLDGKSFAFILTRTDTLNVITSAPGYYEAEELMVVTCDTCTDYGYVVRLEKEEPKPDSIFRNLQVNQAFRLDNLYFDQSSYLLRPESFPQLDKLVKTLATAPNLEIEIAGHTDNVGDRRLNKALSENRAKVIASYISRKGIDEKRIHYNGYGDTKPVAPNDSEENKKKEPTR
ncbi:OmpA family protein [Spirosoma foliorum]|uniref:OmpA family protein n=1 Tax=Spirosoma foliorum TaxID=2710596 RepID=UPI001F0AE881|nr:OmpA family protein [Spirosoma foliorum]